jgi:hypothetical protein
MTEYATDSALSLRSVRPDLSGRLTLAKAKGPGSDPVYARTGFGSAGLSARSAAVALERFGSLSPDGASEYARRLQRQYGNRYLQRELKLSRRESGEQEVGTNLEAAIERKRGSGQTLDEPLRAHMESALGSDFSGVRVHTDSESDSLNRALNAVAFTTGQDVFFSRGAYSPDTSAGRELVAHELTHVVQQGGSSTVQGKMVLGEPGDRYEQEAESVARQVCSAPFEPVQRSCGCGGGSSSGECASCKKKREDDRRAHSLQRVPFLPIQRRLQVNQDPALSAAVVLRSESNHPEEQHCEDVSKDSTATCAAIIDCIEELIEALAGRFADIDNLGGDAGHRDRIRIVQGILRTLMAMAKLTCQNGEYDPELEQEAQKWANRNPGQAPEEPETEPSLREKIANALKKAGIPAWAVAGLIVLIIAALADPEPFTKVALLIGAAAAVIFFIAIGRGDEVPSGATASASAPESGAQPDEAVT